MASWINNNLGFYLIAMSVGEMLRLILYLIQSKSAMSSQALFK